MRPTLFRSLRFTPQVRSDPRQITSDFLARLQMDPGNVAKAGGSEKQDATRGMLSSVGLRDTTLTDGRRVFKENKISPPHAYGEEAMYGEAPKRPRNTLLGPPRVMAERIDPFFIRNSNPLEHASNPLMSFRFLNNIGKLNGRNRTGLTWKSQRAVGKMVRRARAMGVIGRWSNIPRPGSLGDNR